MHFLKIFSELGSLHLRFAEVDQPAEAAGCETDAGVCTTVIDADFIFLGHGHCARRENNIGHDAVEFIRLGGRENGAVGEADDAGRILEVQEHGADAVAVAGRGAANAMNDDQPALGGFDRRRGADLGGGPVGESRLEQWLVVAPVEQVRRGGNPEVAHFVIIIRADAIGSVETHVAAFDFLREEAGHAVVGQRNDAEVFAGFEIGSAGENPHGPPRAAAGVDDVINTVQVCDAVVNALLGDDGVRGFGGGLEQGVWIDIEVHAIVAGGDMAGERSGAPPEAAAIVLNGKQQEHLAIVNRLTGIEDRYRTWKVRGLNERVGRMTLELVGRGCQPVHEFLPIAGVIGGLSVTGLQDG